MTNNTLTRLAGMGIAGTVALAVLAFGCVFAATAGPRQALATRTQALRQTLTTAPPLAQTIVASSAWSGLTSDLAAAQYAGPSNVSLSTAQLGEITSQLHDDFNRGVVHLAPLAADWAGMTSNLHNVTSTLPGAGGLVVKFEITYRQPFTRYTRLVAGHYPAAGGVGGCASPPCRGVSGGSSPRASTASPGSPGYSPLIQVVVSSGTARQFGLHPGSKVRLTGPEIALTGSLAAITLDVTGIVAPRDPSSTFWEADPTVLTPELQSPNPNAPSYWVGGVFAGPGGLAAVQRDFGPEGLAMQWQFPLVFGSLGGEQAQPLYDALNRLGGQSPALSGDVAPAAGALAVSSALLRPLTAFLATTQAVDTLLWLLYVSLAAACLVVLVLAARMIAMRRSPELTMRRARGASLRQIAAAAVRGAAVACVPAAALAVAAAVLVVPGPAPAGGWWAPAMVLVVAVGAPAVVAAWPQRLTRRPHGRRRPRARVRLVAEATACLAAIAGIIVFRQQGTQPGSGVNLYTSAAPVLVAVPAVIVVLRVYPLVLRGLLRGAARRGGATAFLGLARAARTALTPALPAFALVLALSVAAFAGMVRDAVTTGEVAASWQAAGVDETIATAGQLGTGTAISPAAQRAAAAVPGVTHAAAVWQEAWAIPDGQQVTGLVVDPASYAALVAATQTFPQVPARLLAAGDPQQVLASPEAAADLGPGVTTLSTQAAARPIRVRVAGLLAGTPALPIGGAFVIIPMSAVRIPPGLNGEVHPVPVNELLLTGSDIDTARLATVVRAMIPQGVTTARSDILAALTTAPLQHGTFVLFALAIVAAAGLGLAVMLLELALGAAEREATLARLATMGLGEAQRARVVLLEILPAVIAAAVAAGASALVLPRLVAPAVDLSVFTGSPAAVALAPDVASIALPLAGLAVVALVALVIEIRSGRRRGVATSLRAGG